ncbi:MAG: UvrD-helicase domain-containing protein, partial [bacterium]|nr:UvrD-helicase domain-containing protein [bacterium]
MSAGDREADRRARLRAQRELVRPLVVEAGAGTGKTATLVARILAWCLGPGWIRVAERIRQRPVAPALSGRGEDERIAAAVLNGVVAITFTEAAAAEMAERVSAGLVRVRDGGAPAGFEPPEEIEPAVLRQRAALLLGAADQLQVRTIHAFCRKLLAEHPFEAGVHPNFTVDADGAVLREVVEETVEAALPEGYGDPGD